MGIRVLLVDDEPDIRQLYRAAFELAGAEVAEATDGEEGLEVAVRECPDIVILDLMMPGRDGLSTLPELRERCPDTRVLLVTAFGNPETFREGRALGAADCFNKWDFLAHVPDVLRDVQPA